MFSRNLYLIFLKILLFFLTFPFISFSLGGKSFKEASPVGVGFFKVENLFQDEERYYFLTLKPGQALFIKGEIVPQGTAVAGMELYDKDLKLLIKREEIVEEKPKSISLAFLVNSEKKEYKIFIRQYCELFAVKSFPFEIRIENYYDGGKEGDAGDDFENAFLISYGSFKGYLSGNLGNDLSDFYKIEIDEFGDLYIELKPLSKAILSLSFYDPERKLILKKKGKEGEMVKVSSYLTKRGEYFLKISGKGREIIPYSFKILPRKYQEEEKEEISFWEKFNLRFFLGIFLIILILYFSGKKIYNLFKSEK